MPTEQEIRQRALRDVTAAADTSARTKAAIETERAARLAGIATVSAATAARDESVTKADAALAATVDRIGIQHDKDEIAALEQEGAGGKAAADLAEEEKQAAELACPVEKAEADRVFNEAFKAAGRLVGVEADNARRAATAARDAALDEADRTCENAKQAAFAKMNRTFERLKVEHDAARQAAFDKAAKSREKAEERHRKAVDAAEAALATVLAADPQVLALGAECARRMKEADDRFAADSNAIMERQVRELEELRRGGGTS